MREDEREKGKVNRKRVREILQSLIPRLSFQIKFANTAQRRGKRWGAGGERGISLHYINKSS